jgi:transcriptional regulator with XRE-family HTH domain
MKMNVGEKIRALRKSSNLTQKELAKKSGIAEITIRKYENQDRQPKIEQIEKIATALEVTPLEILGFDYWDNAIDTKELSDSASLLDSIKNEYGEDAVQLLRWFNELNEQGKTKAVSDIVDMTEVSKYKKPPTEQK